MPGRPQPPDHSMTSGHSKTLDNGRMGIDSRLTAPDNGIRVKVALTTLRDGLRRSAGSPPQGTMGRAAPRARGPMTPTNY